jgi:hypothetical protein
VENCMMTRAVCPDLMTAFTASSAERANDGA